MSHPLSTSLVVMLAALAPVAAAQAPASEGISAYAEAIVGERDDVGQRLEPRPLARRGDAMRTFESSLWPVAIHGGPDGAAWGVAFEDAYAWLDVEGWPLPPPDGGRGNTDGFDVYLLDTAGSAQVALDVPMFDAPLDAAIVHVRVRRDLPADRRLTCAIQALAEAGLTAADPAEAPELARATATWLAWRATGQLGCDEAVLQASPAAGYFAHARGDGELGALLFEAVSARHDDPGAASFLRDVWTLSRQRSRGALLRGEPDVLRMLDQASRLAHDPLDRVLEGLAVDRALGVSGITAAPELPPPRPFAELTWSQLPSRARPPEPGLEVWGSAFATVDVREASAGSVLRATLEGEPGTEWSLVAVRLDAEGRELGRTRAGTTRRPRAYIPVELGIGTASVVLVASNIPDDDDPRLSRPASSADSTARQFIDRVGFDLDVPGPSARTFRFVVAQGGD